MKRKSEDERLAIPNLVARVSGIIMVVLYVAIGTTIIFRADDQRVVQPAYAIIFGVVLILYGAFRAYKVYRSYHSRHEE